MKTIVKSLLAAVLLSVLLPLAGWSQSCTVSGISLTAAGNSSSACTPGAQYPLAVQITGTWVGSVTIDFSDNAGVAWTTGTSGSLTYTANTSFTLPATGKNVQYRMTFATRTSGTVTGSLLGLNPAIGRRIQPAVAIGSVAYSSVGNATTDVAGTLWVTDVYVMRPMTVTTIGSLNGATVGTDKWIYALYDGSGNLLGNTTTAGVTTAGANAFQEIALTTNVFIQPGLYFIGVQGNGTTDVLRTQAASTYVDTETTSSTGTFATVPTVITLPTTFTANVGPVAYLKGY